MPLAISLFSRSHLGKRSHKVVLTVSHGARPWPQLTVAWESCVLFPYSQTIQSPQQQYLFGSNVTNRCACLNETGTIQSRLAGGCNSIYVSATFQFVHGEKCFYTVSFQWTKENEQTLGADQELKLLGFASDNIKYEIASTVANQERYVFNFLFWVTVPYMWILLY